MTDQNMLALIDRLEIAPVDLPLFYVFYRYLRFLFSDDEGLKAHSMKGVEIGGVDWFYSFYVDFLLFIRGGFVPDVNLNADEKRFSYFEERASLNRFLGLLVGQEIIFRRYIRGLVKRGRIYDVLHHHRGDNLLDFWIRLKDDVRLRGGVENITRKLVFVFGRMNVRRVFVVDFSDSLNLLALHAAKAGGLTVITVPHGYIQDFDELYTYGHLSDVYVCWSRTEAQRVGDLLGDKVAARYFGCPKYSKEYVEHFSDKWLTEALKRSMKKVVLFCSPILGQRGEADYKHCIIWLNDFLRLHGLEFEVKLHQRDAIEEMVSFLQGNGVSLVRGAVEGIFMRTDLVIGFQTTVLYQAAVLNVPSLQIVLGDENCFKFDLVDQVRWCSGLVGDEILSRLTLDGRTLQNNGLDRTRLRSYIECL